MLPRIRLRWVNRVMHLTVMDRGAGWQGDGAALALVAADGGCPVFAGAVPFEEMLAGWRRQQQARSLTGPLIEGRVRPGPPVPGVHRGVAVAVDAGPGGGVDRRGRVGTFDDPLV